MTAVNAFTFGQSLKNIVDSCERQASNPQLNLDPATSLEPTTGNLKNATAYRWLLEILDELYKLYDWSFLQTAKTITLPAGAASVSLPPEYWHTSQEVPMWIISTSSRSPVQLVNRETFFNMYPTSTTSTGVPKLCYIERISGSIFLNPLPDQTYIAELHFFQLPKGVPANFSGVDPAAGITAASITDIPWFPYHTYLEKKLLTKYYLDQDDSRATSADAEAQRLWQQIRQVNWDLKEGGISNQMVMLDPDFFPNPPNL